MGIEDFIKKVSEVTDAATVDRVFGEPLELNDRSFVPVASVRSCFGAGFGRGHCGDEDEITDEGEGGGGGGGMKAEPVAIVEVGDDETVVHPIVDTNRIILGGMILGGLGLLSLGLLLRGR
jgi:uncharacterized spore protein YtfJ